MAEQPSNNSRELVQENEQSSDNTVENTLVDSTP